MPNPEKRTKYILISYRLSGSGKQWLVFGHIDVGHNECIGSYETKEEARDHAFAFSVYRVSVIQGDHYDQVLQMLTTQSHYKMEEKR